MALWDQITWLFRRGPRRPLASRQPLDPRRQDISAPLGLEAVDLAQVDAVNRKNASLERVSSFHVAGRGQIFSPGGADTAVTRLPDDETYAARYHRAYNREEGKEP